MSDRFQIAEFFEQPSEIFAGCTEAVFKPRKYVLYLNPKNTFYKFKPNSFMTAIRNEYFFAFGGSNFNRIHIGRVINVKYTNARNAEMVM